MFHGPSSKNTQPQVAAVPRADHPLFALNAAILLVPLIPLHFRPDSQFYTEALFILLTGVALLAVRGLRLAAVGLAGPLVLLFALCGGVSAAHSLAGHAYGPQVLLFPLYCLFALGLYVFLRSMLQGEGGEGLSRQVATVILFSALLACLPAAFQLNGLRPSFLLVAARGATPAIFGNLFQANLFADWLWLGIFAACFFAASGHLRAWVAASAMAVLAAFALTTTSKSVWLYPAAGLILTIVFRKPGDQRWKRLAGWMAAALLLQLALHLLGRAVGAYEFFGLTNSQSRLLSEVALAQGGEGGGGSIRADIWRRSMAMIVESPWWGWGPGSFRLEALRILAEQGGRAPPGEHGHNLFLHLAAEMGIPLALAVAGLLGWWCLRVWCARLALPGVWALASLGVIGIHSLLEFPLWFAHFLGLAMVFAAVVDREVIDDRGAKRTWEMPLRLLGALSLATVVLLGLQHQRVESAFSTIGFQRLIGMAGPSGFPELDEDTLASLDDLPKWSPWRGYAELAMIYGGNPAPEHAAHWAPLCRQVLYFDAPPVVFARCAMLLQLTGSDEGAQRFAQWGCAGYSRPQDGFPLILRHVAQTMGVTELPAATCLAP